MSAGRDKNARLAWTMVAIVGGMLGLAYAAVPLYEAFCKATGFAGTPLVAQEGAMPTCRGASRRSSARSRSISARRSWSSSAPPISRSGRSSAPRPTT